MNVRLHIDELVLHGIAAADAPLVAASVQAELAELLTAGGVPPGLARGARIDDLDGGEIRIGRAAVPAEVGAQVARALYGGMAR